MLFTILNLLAAEIYPVFSFGTLVFCRETTFSPLDKCHRKLFRPLIVFLLLYFSPSPSLPLPPTLFFSLALSPLHSPGLHLQYLFAGFPLLL